MSSSLSLGLSLSAIANSGPPAIIGLNFSLGDPIGGGQNIILNGANLLGATVSIGGTSQTILSNNGSQLTFALGAHAAGTTTLTVTTALGVATTPFEYWNPGVESGCVLFVAAPDYSAAGDGSWPARVGGVTLASGAAGTPPASGGAPTFDGTTANGIETTPKTSGSFFSLGAPEGTTICIVKALNPQTAAAPSAPFNDPAIWSKTADGTFGVGFSADGVRYYQYSGGYVNIGAPMSAGLIHTVHTRMKHSVSVGLRVDNRAWVNSAIGEPSFTDSKLNLGLGWSGGSPLNGTIYAAAFFSRTIADSDPIATKTHRWAQQQYGATTAKQVACMGDSITAQYGVPADLQTLLGSNYEVYNQGVSGASVCPNPGPGAQYSTTSAYPGALSIVSAGGYAVIMLGTNDTHLTDRSAYQSALTSIVQAAQSAGAAKVFLCSSPPIGTNPYGDSDAILTGELIPEVKAVATATGAIFVDVHSANFTGAVFSDGVHPDATGAQIIANTMYAAIVAAGG